MEEVRKLKSKGKKIIRDNPRGNGRYLKKSSDASSCLKKKRK